MRSKEDASTLGWGDLGFNRGGEANKGEPSGIRASQQLPLAQGHPQFQHVGLAWKRTPDCEIPSCAVTLVDRLMSLGKPICPVQPSARINKAAVWGFQSECCRKARRHLAILARLASAVLWKGSAPSPPI